jgi:hypothetical protein
METKVKNALLSAIIKLLYPLVRILLRNGIPYGIFADLTRWVFVDVAMQEFGISGRKQTDSRVAIITGINRKEIRRLKKMTRPFDTEAIYRYNRAARVIAGWVRDHRFADNKARPKVLPFEKGRTTFSDLVKIYSGDVPPRAILDELLNVNAVQVMQNHRIKLLARAYLPTGDEPTLLSILGTDVSYLIQTIDHNIFYPNDERFFQRKVLYDNVPIEASNKFRRLSAEKSQQLLEVMDSWLSKHDRDVTSTVKGSGRKKVGLGIYYFEEDFEVDQSDSEKNGGKS